MRLLLLFADAIDALNERIGRALFWSVLLMVLICAGNALMRKLFNVSSNAFLEIQWYLFSALFLLGAGYALKHNAHVRIDIFYGRYSPRSKAIVDLLGAALFLLPLALLMTWHAWPMFANSFAIGEMSADAGGLLRWPVKLLLPLGFGLLALQGVAEIIKRVAFLAGYRSDPSATEGSR
jgi:TRAP-type mannitol/chloroaromatic compound transport system permease small subunit